jgi:phospholipase C
MSRCRSDEEEEMSGEIHKSGLPSAGLSRRAFLASAAAVAGAAGLAGVLPESLARAATPSPQKFELSKVKHLVFLMQENRSFDHYFGTFPGARGFNDPTALRLPAGRTVFQQPDPANPDGYQEPYHMSTITTGAAAVPSLSHAWSVQHAAWNGGKMDNWVPAHVAADGNGKGAFTMGYYTEEDIPFHWALAKAFTLCDNYHCSVMGPTTPNRLFMESGGIDQQGVAGGPILDTAYPPPLSYEPGPTTLYNAGISFKYYGAPGWGIAGNTNAFVGFRNGPGEVPDALYHSIQSDGTLWGDGTPGGIGDPATRRRPATRTWRSRRTAPTACCPTWPTSAAPPTSTRRPSRRPALSSSRPSSRPSRPTRSCGTAPCSS